MERLLAEPDFLPDPQRPSPVLTRPLSRPLDQPLQLFQRRLHPPNIASFPLFYEQRIQPAPWRALLRQRPNPILHFVEQIFLDEYAGNQPLASKFGLPPPWWRTSLRRYPNRSAFSLPQPSAYRKRHNPTQSDFLPVRKHRSGLRMIF